MTYKVQTILPCWADNPDSKIWGVKAAGRGVREREKKKRKEKESESGRATSKKTGAELTALRSRVWEKSHALRCRYIEMISDEMSKLEKTTRN